ncbi:MAG TPA: hypothetical protein VFY46_04920 [Acidimicrobiia bacterium]|nr:hypothetical protein [Acidimicrobiia bacterium]
MNGGVPPFRPLLILGTLARLRVDYVLIGGLAATLQGSPLTTGDADICPDPSPENLTRIAEALRQLDARVHASDSPRGLRFDIAPETLVQAQAWNLITEAGRLDISWVPSGTRGYPDLARDAITYELEGFVVQVASLADVIRSKEAAGRERDRASLPTLRMLLERLEREDDS